MTLSAYEEYPQLTAESCAYSAEVSLNGVHVANARNHGEGSNDIVTVVESSGLSWSEVESLLAPAIGYTGEDDDYSFIERWEFFMEDFRMCR